MHLSIYIHYKYTFFFCTYLHQCADMCIIVYTRMGSMHPRTHIHTHRPAVHIYSNLHNIVTQYYVPYMSFTWINNGKYHYTTTQRSAAGPHVILTSPNHLENLMALHELTWHLTSNKSPFESLGQHTHLFTSYRSITHTNKMKAKTN